MGPAAPLSESAVRDRLLGLALALGFDRAGVASAMPGPDTEFVSQWLERGYAGEMAYLGAREAERRDPRVLMPSVKSLLVVGLFHDPSKSAGDSLGGDAQAGPLARVAAYAGGEDYHVVLLDRLRALAAAVEALCGPDVETRCYVDTGPVQERAFAARAGLGWIGKNTCVIDPRLGSRMLLGVLLTDLELPPTPPEPDHCGTCRACLDACPTEAFPSPYVMDATRCISYTTIEQRGPIAEALRSQHGDWLFGCDVCQDVCPFNRKREIGDLPDPLALRERLAPDPAWVRTPLAWVLGLDESGWREATRGTALRRARYRGLLRNALVAAGNAGDPSLKSLIEVHAEGNDAVLAEHARWALARIESGAQA